jgi:hypothetical protein
VSVIPCGGGGDRGGDVGRRLRGEDEGRERKVLPCGPGVAAGRGKSAGDARVACGCRRVGPLCHSHGASAAEGEQGAGLADARGHWAALELGCGVGRCGVLMGQKKKKRPDWVGLVGLGCWATYWAED